MDDKVADKHQSCTESVEDAIKEIGSDFCWLATGWQYISTAVRSIGTSQGDNKIWLVFLCFV